MKPLTCVLLLVSAALLPSPAPAQTKPPKPMTPPTSPLRNEAARLARFDAALLAWERAYSAGDYKKAAEFLSPQSAAAFGVMLYGTAYISLESPGKTPEETAAKERQLKALEAIGKKYGLPDSEKAGAANGGVLPKDGRGFFAAVSAALFAPGKGSLPSLGIGPFTAEPGQTFVFAFRGPVLEMRIEAEGAPNQVEIEYREENGKPRLHFPPVVKMLTEGEK